MIKYLKNNVKCQGHLKVNVIMMSTARTDSPISKPKYSSKTPAINYVGSFVPNISGHKTRKYSLHDSRNCRILSNSLVRMKKRHSCSFLFIFSMFNSCIQPDETVVINLQLVEPSYIRLDE